MEKCVCAHARDRILHMKVCITLSHLLRPQENTEFIAILMNTGFKMILRPKLPKRTKLNLN